MGGGAALARLLAAGIGACAAGMAAGSASAQDEQPLKTASAAGVTWDRGPTAEDFEKAYPQRALKIGMSGRVDLACQIGFTGRLACTVIKEEPSGWGFGRAAVQVAQATMWAAPRLTDGRPSASETIKVPVEFRTE